MDIIYKLTDQLLQTHHGFQWAIGETCTASGEGNLCGPGFLHGYTHPLLAVILNPVHAGIREPRLFLGHGVIARTDRGLKVGCTKMTLDKEIPIPAITPDQRIRFAILCAKEVCKGEKWNKWADNWLSGENGGGEEVVANEAAETKLFQSLDQRMGDMEWSAGEWAAWAAVKAAAAVGRGVYREAWAADAAGWAAEVATLDLIAIAEQAMV